MSESVERKEKGDGEGRGSGTTSLKATMNTVWTLDTTAVIRISGNQDVDIRLSAHQQQY